MSLWSRGPGHTRWYAPTRSFRWQPLAQANPVQPVHRCDLPAAGAPTFLSARACTYLSASKWTSGVSPASSPWSAWTPTLPHGPRPLDRGRPVRIATVSQGQSETVPPRGPRAAGPGPRAYSPLPHRGRHGRRPSLTDRVLWTAAVSSASRSSHRDSRRLSIQWPPGPPALDRRPWTAGVSPARSPWSAWTPTLPHGPRAYSPHPDRLTGTVGDCPSSGRWHSAAPGARDASECAALRVGAKRQLPPLPLNPRPWTAGL